MKTFERYFIDDKELQKENKNPFYIFAQKEEVCDQIFKEFGIDPEKGHIICGHIPVKFKSGESPIKANGKLLIIDRRIIEIISKNNWNCRIYIDL